MPFEKEIEELKQRRAKALEMGGTEKIKKHHDKGKLTARERIDRLLDPDTFLEVGMLNHSDTAWPSGICVAPAVALIFWWRGRRRK